MNYVHLGSHSLKTDTILYKVSYISIKSLKFLTWNCNSEFNKAKDKFKTNVL